MNIFNRLAGLLGFHKRDMSIYPAAKQFYGRVMGE